LTLLWIVVSWPPEGLAGLTGAMAEYFRSRIDLPFEFAVLNLYNVSFALSALALAVVLRRQFFEFPHCVDFAFANIIVAGAMYVASGVVPLVAAPVLLQAGDASALNALEGVSMGLLLGATMASGFALATFSFVGFRSKRLPFVLCSLILAAGLIETVEWANPAILVLDPLLGSFWSFWLGSLLWRNRLARGTDASTRRSLPLEETMT
jgi:hypothetical protein